MQHCEYEQRVSEHANPPRLTYELYRRNPRFDSAQQFGTFICLVADHWMGGAPGLGSSTMLALEHCRLGCLIQTSPNYSASQDLQSVYHTGWIMRVLRATRARLIEENRQKERDKHATGHPSRCKCAGCIRTQKTCFSRARQTGELDFSIWTNVDVFGSKQCDVAKATKVSDSTVSRRLRAIRAIVEDELKREHKLRV